jgi:hypothetical protein
LLIVIQTIPDFQESGIEVVICRLKGTVSDRKIINITKDMDEIVSPEVEFVELVEWLELLTCLVTIAKFESILGKTLIL